MIDKIIVALLLFGLWCLIVWYVYGRRRVKG